MKSYKGYKEMTRCVLEARDEHLKKKRRQQAVIRRCVPVMSTFCIALILGLGYWKYINKMPKIPDIETISPINEATTEAALTTEKETSTVNNTESNATQQVTEPKTTQTATINVPSAVSTQNNVTVNVNIITEKPSEPPKNTTADKPKSDTPTEQPTILDGDQSGCPDNHVYLHWNEMTINQQYFMAEFGVPTLSYSTAEKEVPANEVGEYISKAYMSGYDWYELIYYHCETEAYKIKGDDEIKSIAIKFANDEKYYLYTLNEPNNADQLSG